MYNWTELNASKVLLFIFLSDLSTVINTTNIMLRVDRIRPSPDAHHFPVQFEVSQEIITYSNIHNIFTKKNCNIKFP